MESLSASGAVSPSAVDGRMQAWACWYHRRLRGSQRGGFSCSDVDGLLLGRQQAVHGCRHRLHVNLENKLNAEKLLWQQGI